MRTLAITLLTALVVPSIPVVGANHWPQFRGVNGQGIADQEKPPIEFSQRQNLLWKTALPPGHSSPVIWDDHVFLTAQEGNQLTTLCLLRKTGSLLWKREAPEHTLAQVHRFNSTAASTPVTDGQRVYSYFGSFGVIAYDFSGKESWRVRLPSPPTQYGAASSPIIWHDKLILQQDGNSTNSALVFIDTQTGKIHRTVARPALQESYATPMLWQHDGLEELITLGNGRLVSYDPNSGVERWWSKGVTFQPVNLPVAGAGLLFASSTGTGDPKEPIPYPTWEELVTKYDTKHNGTITLAAIPETLGIQFRLEISKDLPGNYFPIKTVLSWTDENKDGFITKAEWDADEISAKENEDNVMAIKPGGQRDITKSHLVWKSKRGISEMPSPLFYRDRLWFVRNGGMVTCYDPLTGKIILDRERLAVVGHYVSSPVAANGYIYTAAESGTVCVFKATGKLEVVARNALEESITATPAIVDDKIYVRGRDHLFAFGKP